MRTVGYNLIEHAPGLFEVIFKDTQDSTIDRFIVEAERLITKQTDCSHLYFLYNLSSIAMPTPYVITSWRGLGRWKVIEDIRIAFFVGHNPYMRRAQHHIMQIHHKRKTQNVSIGVFFEHEGAMQWLRDDPISQEPPLARTA
jgi:hypothetical protein